MRNGAEVVSAPRFDRLQQDLPDRDLGLRVEGPLVVVRAGAEDLEIDLDVLSPADFDAGIAEYKNGGHQEAGAFNKAPMQTFLDAMPAGEG